MFVTLGMTSPSLGMQVLDGQIGVSFYTCIWLATIHAFAPFALCME